MRFEAVIKTSKGWRIWGTKSKLGLTIRNIDVHFNSRKRKVIPWRRGKTITEERYQSFAFWSYLLEEEPGNKDIMILISKSERTQKGHK